MELEHDIELSAGKRLQLHRHCQDILKPRLHEVSQMKVEKRKIALNLFRDLEVITFEKEKLLFQSRNPRHWLGIAWTRGRSNCSGAATTGGISGFGRFCDLVETVPEEGNSTRFTNGRPLLGILASLGHWTISHCETRTLRWSGSLESSKEFAKAWVLCFG